MKSIDGVRTAAARQLNVLPHTHTHTHTTTGMPTKPAHQITRDLFIYFFAILSERQGRRSVKYYVLCNAIAYRLYYLFILFSIADIFYRVICVYYSQPRLYLTVVDVNVYDGTRNKYHIIKTQSCSLYTRYHINGCAFLSSFIQQSNSIQSIIYHRIRIAHHTHHQRN